MLVRVDSPLQHVLLRVFADLFFLMMGKNRENVSQITVRCITNLAE